MSEQYTSQNVCPKCNGSGWEPAGNERGVRRCDCMESMRLDRMLSDAKIPRRYEHCDLESYQPLNKSQEKANTWITLTASLQQPSGICQTKTEYSLKTDVSLIIAMPMPNNLKVYL